MHFVSTDSGGRSSLLIKAEEVSFFPCCRDEYLSGSDQSHFWIKVSKRTYSSSRYIALSDIFGRNIIIKVWKPLVANINFLEIFKLKIINLDWLTNELQEYWSQLRIYINDLHWAVLTWLYPARSWLGLISALSLSAQTRVSPVVIACSNKIIHTLVLHTVHCLHSSQI